MTLIIALGNSDYAVLASDRRFSVAGKPYDDEANKATILATEDARVAIAFTGLAFTPDKAFDTGKWLLKAVSDAVKSQSLIETVLAQLTSRATADFATIQGISNQDKRLTIVIIGYIYTGQEPELRCWKITNFENLDGKTTPTRPEFDLLQFLPEPEFRVALELAGHTSPVANADIIRLKSMLISSAPVKGVEAKVYHTIKKTALAPTSQSYIGRQATTCRIMSDNSQIMICTYYSDYTTRKAFGVNTVFGVAGDPMITDGGQLIVGNQMPHTTLPRANRNAPCPCGNGEKYKRCHGLLEYPYLPLRAELSFNETKEAPPSGFHFIVESRGASAKG